MQSDRTKLFGDSPEEEEENHTNVSRKKSELLANIPIIGYLVTLTMSSCARRWADVARRRRSYKLSLFFQLQMLFGLAAFLAFFIVAMQDISLLGDPSRMPAECVLPSQVVTSGGTSISLFTSGGELDVTGIYNYTTEARSALSCSNDNSQQLDATCELSQFQSLVMLMLATGICFIISMVVSCLVFSGFNFFSNIPMESLDVDVTSYKVSFLAAMCRFGPWLVRGMTLVNIALVLSMVLLPTIADYCLGTFNNTHDCVNMYDDCVKLQFDNCRYYYSDNCVGPDLPHSSSQAANFQQCKNTDFAAKFSGRFDARLVFPTPCSRCWALHADCLDPEINRMRFADNSTSPEFVFTNQSTVSPAILQADLALLGRDIQCRCIEGLDLGGAKAALFDSVKLTNNNTNCSSYVNTTNTVCPSTPTTGLGAMVVDLNATFWSTNWQDSVLNKTGVVQECSWAPDVPAFYYDSTECTQEGSTLNRFVFILGYITILLVGIFIVAGLAVKYSVQSETWSYSPHPPNEPWYWKVLRLLGPG